ncbi:MAG: hypothetical protein ACRD4T_08650, partial [Candidatus Acidiferrales bacterium]
MGLLFVDVGPRGIVIGSDSQDVILYNNRYRIRSSSSFRKDKVLQLQLPKFGGFLGYIGTENIGQESMRNWLDRFVNANSATKLDSFCNALAQSLSREWQKRNLKSGLWVFVTGYENRKPRFWFVNNIDSMDLKTGLYFGIRGNFKAVNDLEENYIKPRLQQGMSRKKLLKGTIFHFRNGVIFPFAQVYTEFNRILESLAHGPDRGFGRIRTLRRFAFAARQRLELVKRLYSKKHGLYQKTESPIEGEVNIYCISSTCQAFKVHKESFDRLGAT